MVSAAEARRRAERCLAVARSTTHEGERAAAIGRAEAILEAHGLGMTDLAPSSARFSGLSGRTGKAPAEYGPADVAETMRSYNEALRRSAEAAGAAEHETTYAARRRNFDQACAEAAARDRAREERSERA